MATNDTATENGIAPSEQARRDELRGEYEGFEFRVPAEGRVLVTNVSYGSEEKDEHRYVVSVSNGFVQSCTCPHHEHRQANCKHMQATSDQSAVLLAASEDR